MKNIIISHLFLQFISHLLLNLYSRGREGYGVMTYYRDFHNDPKFQKYVATPFVSPKKAIDPTQAESVAKFRAGLNPVEEEVKDSALKGKGVDDLSLPEEKRLLAKVFYGKFDKNAATGVGHMTSGQINRG